MNELAIDKNEYLVKITNITYFLHALGVFFFLPLLAGFIILYLKKEDVKGTWLESHFRWLSRTFWFYMLWLTIGIILTMLIVGIFILAINHIWLIYRIIKGWLVLNEHKQVV